MSQRGLARMCGKSHQALTYLTKSLASKTTIKRLQRFVGKDLTLASKASSSDRKTRNITVYNCDFCFAVIKHYAIEGNEIAEVTLDAIGSIGLTSYIQAKTGWLPNQYQSSQPARESINRIMDKPRKFHPLFGDESMNKIASFLKVGREHPKLAKWMWSFVYHTLSAQERADLNDRNPVQENGHRRQAIHQWMEDHACDSHKQHFDKIMMIIQNCPSEQDFLDLYARLVGGSFQRRLFDF
jgi:hypothetical protein